MHSLLDQRTRLIEMVLVHSKHAFVLVVFFALTPHTHLFKALCLHNPKKNPWNVGADVSRYCNYCCRFDGFILELIFFLSLFLWTVIVAFNGVMESFSWTIFHGATQKQLHCFWQNFIEVWGMIQGRDHYTLMLIQMLSGSRYCCFLSHPR